MKSKYFIKFTLERGPSLKIELFEIDGVGKLTYNEKESAERRAHQIWNDSLFNADDIRVEVFEVGNDVAVFTLKR